MARKSTSAQTVEKVEASEKKAAVESLPAFVSYGQICMGKKNGPPIQ